MMTMMGKLKSALISWAIATILGAVAISLDLSPDAVVIASISAMTVIYLGLSRLGTRSVASRTVKINSGYVYYVPQYVPPVTVSARVEEFGELKRRAVQQFHFHSEWSKYGSEKLEAAYLQALLQTILQDHILGSKRLASFSELFARYIDTFEVVNRKSNLSIDEVLVTIQAKDHRTELQTEFLRYLASRVSELPERDREQVKRVYTIHDENLFVKSELRNWLGMKMASTLQILESRKYLLGIQDLLRFVANDKD